MIDRTNLTTLYPSLKQSDLPAVLQQQEYAFVAENLDLYDKDESIKEYIDTFLTKLNQAVDKYYVQAEKADKPTKENKSKSEYSPFVPMTQAIAAEIMNQFGGKGFVKMTGAKDFALQGDKLLFTIGQNSGGCKQVQVQLGYDDYYQLAFLNGKGKVLEEFEAVVWEDLPELFTKVTGMDTVMPKIVRNESPRTDVPKKKAGSPEKAVSKTVPAKPQENPKGKEKSQSKEKRSPKSPKKREKQEKKAPEPKKRSEKELLVEKLPADVAFIKRYVGLHKKVKSQAQILTFIHSLQKAITEHLLTKESAYAKELTWIQNALIICYEKMGNEAMMQIDKQSLAHYLTIVNRYCPMLSVVLLKRYIALNGKKDVKEKAQRLLDQMAKAVEGGTITKEDRYAQPIQKAYTALREYLKGKTTVLMINESELNGLAGLEGLGFVPEMLANAAGGLIALGVDRFTRKKEVATLQGIDDEGVVNSMDLVKMTFETLPLSDGYDKLIGTPSKNFTAMVYGKPGSGKTTWCILFANYLAEKHGLRVLFATIEEGVNHTSQDKWIRLQAAHPKVSVSKLLPSDLSLYDVVFVDSINSFRLTTEELRGVRSKYPSKIFVWIFQATKEGSFKGSQEFEHDVDVVLRAESGVISTEGSKNRFGKAGNMRVW